MNIHEYQGKSLFRGAGLPVVAGVHCTSVEQALSAYDDLASKIVAVKSQIHAGGRGKGILYDPETGAEVMQGGVKIAFNRDDVETYATNLSNLQYTYLYKKYPKIHPKIPLKRPVLRVPR